MDESPVFLTGLARTGKTALRLALGAHPGLSMTRKTHMWASHYGRYGDLNDPASLERCLKAILSDPGVARLLPEPNVIRREFANRNRTYPELFGVLHSQHARRLEKSRWGEQAAYLEQYADPIFSTWPEARMIHMVRHPSDWIASGSQRRPGGVGRELAKWASSAELALSNRSTFGDRYLVVHFESLLSDPVPTLQEVTSFIGEETNFGMGQTLLAATPEPSDSPLVPAARQYVEEKAGSLARALGYPAREVPSIVVGMARLVATLWFGVGRSRTAGPGAAT